MLRRSGGRSPTVAVGPTRPHRCETISPMALTSLRRNRTPPGLQPSAEWLECASISGQKKAPALAKRRGFRPRAGCISGHRQTAKSRRGSARFDQGATMNNRFSCQAKWCGTIRDVCDCLTMRTNPSLLGDPIGQDGDLPRMRSQRGN
jgi:hypothetical protein